jgi:S1-C subfamily serine protease
LQGFANAERQLAFAYAQGLGVEKNHVEAFKWSRKAAEQGDAQAQTFLAMTYASGDGTATDKIEALAWFDVAAASGDKDALKYRDQLTTELGDSAGLSAKKRGDELASEVEAVKAGRPVSLLSPADLVPSNQMPRAYGSGSIISAQGHVLTAAHVVAGASSIMVVTSGGLVPATILSVDQVNDLAVLKISRGPYTPLTIAPSRAVRLGQAVSTIGFPNVEFQGFAPKVTRGEISSTNGFQDDPREWQISVPVQPGNSGGPLLDERGNLVGVVESKLNLKSAEGDGGAPQNVNYAIKSAYALALLEPYLDRDSPAPDSTIGTRSFEDMVAKAKDSVVLVLVY